MKKIVAYITMSIILAFGFCSSASAADNPTYEYTQILNSINKEYNLNIGVTDINYSKITPKEFEKTVRTIALQQSQLEFAIANREVYKESNTFPRNSLRAVKSISRDVWSWETKFKINATYDVNGNSISNPRGISVSTKPAAALQGYSYIVTSGPTTSIIDSSRTLTVTYYGSVHTDAGILNNIKFYTEFYYDS